MKHLGKIGAYILLTLLLTLFFLPKVQLYYKAETLLNPYKITLSKEHLKDAGFSLHVKDALLYYDDLEVGTISNISITPLLIYNSINVSSFTLHSDMEQFVPTQIDGISVTYSIFNPLHVTLYGEGQFGMIEGEAALLDHNISIRLQPSKLLEKQNPFWLRRMKKDSEGGYVYESAY